MVTKTEIAAVSHLYPQPPHLPLALVFKFNHSPEIIFTPHPPPTPQIQSFSVMDSLAFKGVVEIIIIMQQGMLFIFHWRERKLLR